MLKYFYKTFLIAILSGSLLSLQSGAALAAGTNSTDSKGVITNTQSHQFDKVTDSDMLASLGMLSGGFITGRMLKSYTPVTTDVMIAGAAGVAFIAGEVLSNMKFKGTIDAMTIEVSKKSDGKVNEEQIQRLQDLKKSYEEAKNTTKTKKMLQMASAVAFGVASATAGYMAYNEYQAAAGCVSAMTTSLAALNTCPEADTPQTVAVYKPECARCALQVKELQIAFAKIEAGRISPGPSLLEDKAIKPTQAAAMIPKCSDMYPGAVTPMGVSAKIASTCGLALKAESLNQIYSTIPPSKIVFQSNDLLNELLFKGDVPKISYERFQSRDISNNSMIKTALDFFFPTAQASWLPMLGLGGGLLTSFVLGTSAAATQIDMYMFVPFNRSLAFAALGGVALLSANSSQNVMDKLDENIAKIDTILAGLDKMAAGVKAQNLTQQQISIKTVNRENQAIIPFSKNNSKTDCLMNNSTENCKLASNQLSSMPGFANLPDSFKDIATQSVSLGDKLSGSSGLSGSTLASAEALGNKQNAIAKLLANRNAAYEKLTGGKVNLKNEQGKFLDGLKGAWKKSLQKQGMTATGMMASIGNSGISGAGSSNGFKANEVAPKSPAVTANVVDISAQGDDKDKDTLNLDFKEAPAENFAAVDMSGGTSSGGSAPEYIIDSNEINGKNGPSLFEVISGRYIKSGYPKLLEEEPTKN